MQTILTSTPPLMSHAIPSLLVLLPLFFIVYTFARFPDPPKPPVIHPSLASLPPSCPSWAVYPEDLFEGGSYAMLPQGRTRYWLIGPKNGPRVVLIHGISIPSIGWKDVAPALASSGYCVLLYDLYGRGYSDAPDVTYDVTLHTTQLALLMQHVRWDDAYIVGLSMGGAIAAAFAVQFPHLVNGKVALVAPTGLMESADFSYFVKFMTSPLVQSIVSVPPFRQYMRRLVKGGSKAVVPMHPIRGLQAFNLPHFNAAVISSFRDGPVRGLAYAFSALGNTSNEVLLFHGTADRTVPYKYASKLQELIPQAKLVTIKDGSHDITLTHPDQVNPALVRFLSGSLV